MNPLPLRHQRRIYAYACGRCGAVSVVGSYLGYDPASKDERVRRQARSSESNARRCCTCRGCGAELPDRTHGRCAPCEAKESARTDAIATTVRAQDDARHARNVATIAAFSGGEEAAFALAARMSDLSEECWCAGWLDGCETALWAMVQDPDPVDHEWGMGTVTAADVAQLRRLSDDAGGWWRWDNEAGGTVFVPLAEWVTRCGTQAGCST